VKGVGSAIAIFVVGFSALASAYDKTMDSAAQGQAGRDVRIGVTMAVKKDIQFVD
jgi:hypothetical protein